MPSRLAIVIALVVSLLFGAQAQRVSFAMEAETPACEATKCMRGCCQSTECCASQEKGAPQPARIPAPQRGGLDLAALGLLTISFLYVLPPVEAKAMVAQDAAIPHALPRLAVSCIRLI